MWGDGSRVAKEINGDHSNAVGFREGVWAAEPPSVHWFISLSATGRQSTGMSTEGWGRFIPLFCLLIKGHEKLHGVIIIIKKRYSKKKLETFLLLLLLETFLAPQCFIFYFLNCAEALMSLCVLSLLHSPQSDRPVCISSLDFGIANVAECSSSVSRVRKSDFLYLWMFRTVTGPWR